VRDDVNGRAGVPTGLPPVNVPGLGSGDPTTLPRWSYPLVLVLLGIVLYVGSLPTVVRVGVGLETALFLTYLLLRPRRARRPPPAKVLPLFPGHLLLLLALSLVPAAPVWLSVLWMVVPLASVTYDFVASLGLAGSEASLSILSLLYCIIWGDLLFLMERIIVLGRGLTGTWENVAGVGFGLFGVVWLLRGVWRHWRTKTGQGVRT